MNDADFEATVRYRRGAAPQAVIDGMVADGIDAESARIAVVKVQKRIKGEDRKRGVFNLTIGSVIFVLGTGVTVWSWATWGGSYVVAYGAILAGLAWALLGLGQISAAGQDSDLARQSILRE
jgi:hypothetical protein